MDEPTSTSETPNFDLLTAGEAAKILKVDQSTVYEMISHKEIPAVIFNRTKRIRKVDLDDFIREHMSF